MSVASSERPRSSECYQPMSYICKEFSLILTYALRNAKYNSNSWAREGFVLFCFLNL